MLLHLVALATATASVERVGAWLGQCSDVTMLPASACSPGIVFRGDLRGSRLEGASAYADAARVWHDDCAELLGPAYSTQVIRVAELSPNNVAVRWRAEWSPASVGWLEGVAQLLGWEIERFDIDPYTESSFSFSGVARLLASAAASRRLALPCACIEGRSELRLDAEQRGRRCESGGSLASLQGRSN